MSIHTQITSYSQEVAMQIKKKMEYDLQSLVKDGHLLDHLTLCFYRDEPLRYSIRIENRIILDRWLKVEFTTDESI